MGLGHALALKECWFRREVWPIVGANRRFQIFMSHESLAPGAPGAALRERGLECDELLI